MNWETVAIVAVLIGIVAFTRRQQRIQALRMPSLDEPGDGEDVGSTAQGDTPEHVARIRDYLERYRSAYNADALRRKLLADGHDRMVVDQAMAQVFGKKGRPLAQRRFYAKWARREWIIFAGMLLFNALLLPALVAYATNYSPYGPDALLITLSIPLIVLGELVLTGLFRNRFPVVHPVFWASLIYFALAPVSIGVCITIIDDVASEAPRGSAPGGSADARRHRPPSSGSTAPYRETPIRFQS